MGGLKMKQSEKLLMGITFTEDKTYIIINKEAPDSVLGIAFADLTQTLNEMRPEALKVATALLEGEHD